MYSYNICFFRFLVLNNPNMYPYVGTEIQQVYQFTLAKIYLNNFVNLAFVINV